MKGGPRNVSPSAKPIIMHSVFRNVLLHCSYGAAHLRVAAVVGLASLQVNTVLQTAHKAVQTVH